MCSKPSSTDKTDFLHLSQFPRNDEAENTFVSFLSLYSFLGETVSTEEGGLGQVEDFGMRQGGIEDSFQK